MQLEFSGSAPYDYSEGPTGKLSVEVEIEGVRIAAVIDTGAPYLICEPSIAEQLSFSPSEFLDIAELRTHLGTVSGRLYRARLTLVADSGASTELQATVFVPDPNDWKDNPSFLGFHGCLERIRIAIDPGSENLYFGHY